MEQILNLINDINFDKKKPIRLDKQDEKKSLTQLRIEHNKPEIVHMKYIYNKNNSLFKDEMKQHTESNTNSPKDIHRILVVENPYTRGIYTNISIPKYFSDSKKDCHYPELWTRDQAYTLPHRKQIKKIKASL